MWTEQNIHSYTAQDTTQRPDVLMIVTGDGGSVIYWDHLQLQLTVYSSVSQNIFMDQFRCIKDLHSF